MTRFLTIAVSLFLASLTLAQGNSDAVNERIPVHKAALEDHWKVDCARVQEDLLALASRKTPTHNCAIASALQREIHLCAFIYQPPGEHSRHECPDYSGFLDHLVQAGKPGKCSSIVASIQQKMRCEPRVP